MLWLSIEVSLILHFLAPITFYSSIKVVILALATDPSSIWEVELLILPWLCGVSTIFVLLSTRPILLFISHTTVLITNCILIIDICLWILSFKVNVVIFLLIIFIHRGTRIHTVVSHHRWYPLALILSVINLLLLHIVSILILVGIWFQVSDVL